jgi:hypothetical protein
MILEIAAYVKLMISGCTHQTYHISSGHVKLGLHSQFIASL